MVVSKVALTLSEIDRRNVITSLTPLIVSTRFQPGCRACVLLADCDDHRKLTLWEEWETQEELERHLCSADYRLVLAAIDLSQEPPHIQFDTVTMRRGFEFIAGVRSG